MTPPLNPSVPDTQTAAPERDPRVYFAAERTLLAWIRTGLGLMGLGFAIARFGLFIRQINMTGLFAKASFPGSTFSGISLIVIGVLVNVLGMLDYAHTVRELKTGAWVPGRISRMGIALASALAVVGILMAVRLFLIQ
jgi:putative membrane protein